MFQKNFSKMIALVLSAMTMAGTLAGCGSTVPGTEAAKQENTQSTAQHDTAGKVYKIGISQFANHPSLDNCREGFIEGLRENGYEEGKNVEFIYQNAQADTSMSQQIATQFVSSKVDMIAAIATPAAQFAYAAAEKAKTPVVYVAVSDPVGAGLTGEDGKSGKTITGVSDLIPAEKQLEMIRAFLPTAKKIGILFSTGEVNSEAQIKLYEAAASQYGFSIETAGVATTADVALAAQSLAAKVDCFVNLTDNTVVSALATELDKANAAGIPVFGSEVEQVKNGCLASEGIDYIALGKQTGAMAAKVLGGQDITKMSFETVTEFSADVNTTALAKLGLTLPDAYKDAAKHE